MRSDVGADRSGPRRTSPHLVVALLGEEATLSDDQVQGCAGHQQAVAHVAKHHRKQEGEGDDGVGSCIGQRVARY